MWEHGLFPSLFENYEHLLRTRICDRDWDSETIRYFMSKGIARAVHM